MGRDGAAAAAGGNGERAHRHASIGKVCVLRVLSSQATDISTGPQVALENVALSLYISGSLKVLPVRAVASIFACVDKSRELHKSRKLLMYAADGSYSTRVHA